MATTQRLSPTAHLLRTSRLFSLPPPLPRPAPSIGAIITFGSDTATLPYPTHAAIETTPSSLARGDWGLKRSLPLKSTTATTTPVIRVDKVDSLYHITDFDSAADHTLTLQKWKEMGIPISMTEPPKRLVLSSARTLRAPQSVFESHYDNTDLDPTRPGSARWRYKGPWLAGQTEGEFQQFLQKGIKRRKGEFHRFLRDRLGREMRAAREVEAVRDGNERGAFAVESTDEEFFLHMKALRQDPNRLHNLIQTFLDLPVEDPVKSSSQSSSGQYRQGQEVGHLTPNVELGQPKTHPSAGLSYSRTASHIHNHPVLGPMAQNPPVQARVLEPQNVAGYVRNKATLGVGGIVAPDNVLSSYKSVQNDPHPMTPGITSFEPDIPGGAKVWVRPLRSNVDSKGHIKLHVERAHKDALAIYEGQVAEVHVEGPASQMGTLDNRVPNMAPARRTGTRTLRIGKIPSSVRDSGRATPLSPDSKESNSTSSILNRLQEGED